MEIQVRPELRWIDRVRDDLREKQLSVKDVQNRTKWRQAVTNIDPTPVSYTHLNCWCNSLGISKIKKKILEVISTL